MSGDEPDRMTLNNFALADSLANTEMMAKLRADCAAALKNQLNINKRNPVLSALENKWKTMDAFSKRELGSAKKGY